jgi:threonine/homoserine/homoserine lactone efflux protein
MLTPSSAALLALGITLVLVMPGPTNTLLAAAGLQQGVRRAARLTWAELAGYFVAISVWGHFLAQAAHTLPWLPKVVRIASCLYIAYLAVRMWRAALDLPLTTQPLIGLRTLFVATMLNPKAILFAGTIFPAVAFETLPAYFASMAIFTVLLLPIGLAWVAFGAALGSGKFKGLKPAYVQRCASIVLGAFSLSLAWTLIH